MAARKSLGRLQFHQWHGVRARPRPRLRRLVGCRRGRLGLERRRARLQADRVLGERGKRTARRFGAAPGRRRFGSRPQTLPSVFQGRGATGIRKTRGLQRRAVSRRFRLSAYDRPRAQGLGVAKLCLARDKAIQFANHASSARGPDRFQRQKSRGRLLFQRK